MVHGARQPHLAVAAAEPVRTGGASGEPAGGRVAAPIVALLWDADTRNNTGVTPPIKTQTQPLIPGIG